MQNFAVIDLGFGDSGKGTIVDALSKKFGNNHVIRFNGGAQAAHNVIDNDGKHHTFSQLGSASFNGAVTNLSRFMFLRPEFLINEIHGFEKTTNKRFDPSNLRIDTNAKIITPIHEEVNKDREAINRHGSCGIGFGVAVEESTKHPECSIRFMDIFYEDSLFVKLERQKKLYGKHNINLENFKKSCSRIRNEYFRIVNANYFKIIADKHYCIFEGAQGVLLDEQYGFAPHTTWSKTTYDNISQITDAPVRKIGVIRSYCTRHGNGPMPTEGFGPSIPEPHNSTGIYQGHFRSGPLDLELLKYSLKVCKIDCLAITHLDKGPFYCSMKYESGESLKVPKNEKEQHELTKWLLKQKPIVRRVSTAKEIVSIIENELCKKCFIESYGPTYKDKVFNANM